MTSRSLSGLRPASFTGLGTRPSVEWTPDFSAGAAGLEVERILNGFHHGFRSNAIVSGALKLVARPEDVLCATSAWIAWTLEAADAVYVWRRTRTWQSLLDPWITPVDSVIGVAAVTIGSRSMRLEPQLDGTAWTNRMLAVRMAAVPLGDRRGLQLLAGAGIQLLPHLAWQPPGSRRRIVAHAASPLASAFVQAYVISGQMRAKARRIDARALRWADEELRAALAAEEATFVDDVLRPAPRALADIEALLPHDRAAAVERAEEEERRIRGWMAHGTAPLPTSADRADQLDQVPARVRRLSQRIQGGVRVLSSLADVVEITRRTHHSPTRARVAQGALAVRGLVGGALATGALARLVGDEGARRVVGATDVLVTVATGAHQLAERHDRSVAGWVERTVYEVSATSGAASHDGRGPLHVQAAVATVRSIVAWRDTGAGPDAPARAVHQRLASVVDEVVRVTWTAEQVGRVFATGLDQSRRLTAATLDMDAHWTGLDDVRVRQRAFVHDGLAQVLAAVRSGEGDDGDLRRWLAHERIRIDARCGYASTGHGGDLAEAISDLVDEFARRGLDLLAETSELPDWSSTVGGSVAQIVREAINNVSRHTTGDSAWCGVLQQDDGSILVRICDFSTAFPVFRPGSGTGTATMISLARLLGADIEWLQTRTGGTEVRLVVHDPSEAALV